MKSNFDYSGSSFDSFLEEEGIWEEVEAVAVKRVLTWQLEQAMREQKKTKKTMAEELNTSRSQLDRLLDPQNTSVSLETITRAAKVLGKRVSIRIADAKRKSGSGHRERRTGPAEAPANVEASTGRRRQHPARLGAALRRQPTDPGKAR